MRKEYVGAALLSNSLLDCASRPIFESAICQPFQTGCQMQTDLTESTNTGHPRSYPDKIGGNVDDDEGEKRSRRRGPTGTCASRKNRAA